MNRKLGQGSLAAMGRLGHKEIGRTLVAFPSNPGILEEPGTFNNPTYSEISEQRGSVYGQSPKANQKDLSKDEGPAREEVVPQKDYVEPERQEPDFEPEME